MTYTKARPEKKSRQNVAPSMKKKKKAAPVLGSPETNPSDFA